ncbi:hypothetical protein BJX70DRAFT_390777 [Aspergillus crustosus]
MATLTETVPAVSTGSAIPTYHQVPETSFDLDWADLSTLDLSQSAFFYIVNFGLSQEQVDDQFSIGQQLFNLPLEEKLKYRADLENGGYNGYKPMGLRYRKLPPGVRDKTEIYNIPKVIPALSRPPTGAHHDQPTQKSSISREHIHDQIVSKLLVLIAIILELPEDHFSNIHRYSEPRSAENESKGHTDFGSLMLLFRQPVAALQVRTPEGGWKWVKPYPGSITVNLADLLQFLTNGFLTSSIHRVAVPPPDQRDVDRLGVLYFVRPEDKTELRPVASALLTRLGFDQVVDNSAVGIMAGEWVKARVAKGLPKLGNKLNCLLFIVTPRVHM